MKKNIGIWQFSLLSIVFALGSIFHFLYDWTNLKIIAAFSSVNESTFEHMKILFFPMLFASIFQSFYFKNEYNNFWTIKLKGTLVGVLLIPILFYTLTGAFGTLKGYQNILIFFFSILIAYVYEAKLFNLVLPCKSREVLAKILLVILAVLFIVFTFYPPKIPLFLDPIYNLYGIF